MHVYLNVVKRSVVVSGLVEQDGQFAGTDHMARVNVGQQLAGISYQQLRDLGDGRHELPISPHDFVVSDDPSYDAGNDVPTHWLGWAGYAVASFLLAAAGYGVCLMAENSEASTRVHWLIAATYNWGGKEAVAALFVGIGCLFLITAAVTFFRTDPAS